MRAIYFFVAFVCMAASFSCSKDNTNVGTPPYMDAKVDGATVQFNTYSAVQNGSNLQINGTSTAANANIALSINSYSSGQTGTYSIGVGNFNTATYSDPTGGYSAGNSGGSGTVTISFNNGSSIDGTFTFTATNLSAKTKVITEGRFKIYF
jgi:hypothetical protein